jgi:D-lactate dehydrogenase (cytochrome)
MLERLSIRFGLRIAVRPRLGVQRCSGALHLTCRQNYASLQHSSSRGRQSLVPIIVTASTVSIIAYFLHRKTIPTLRNNDHSTLSLDEQSPVLYDLTPSNVGGARDEFIQLLTAERVSDDLDACIAHSSTEWSPAPGGDADRPHLIVQPESTEEVSAIAKICHRRRIPMIAFSGGTSLEGTLAAIHGGVCIDFAHMNKVVAIHPADMDIVVQPAVSYVELNQTLAEDGFFFPPDPGPGAQIGGMIAQGCSGTNAYKYGTMKDWVLGLTVVLADGTVIKTRHRPRKSSAGYNLTQLMVGSEGTLGFVTEASLRMTRKPENIKVALATFPTMHTAVDTVLKVLQSDMTLEAIELMDDVTVRGVNQSGYCDREYAQLPTLFIKFSGEETSVRKQIARVKEFARGASYTSFEVAEAEESEQLWAARKAVLWALLALKEKPEDGFLSGDICVPVSRMADIIEDTHRRLAQSGMLGSCVGHVGDGTSKCTGNLIQRTHN